MKLNKKFDIIKIDNNKKLRNIITSGKFNNSIQIKNTEHICNDGSVYDYSSIIDMSNLFRNCTDLSIVPLFDTSNVVNMRSMFDGCCSLTSIPLFDTSNVFDMNAMFQYCISLKSIPLFDISNVTDMYYMFHSCSKLSIIQKIKFFYQDDNFLLQTIEQKPELFSDQKLNNLISKFDSLESPF